MSLASDIYEAIQHQDMVDRTKAAYDSLVKRTAQASPPSITINVYIGKQ